MSRRNPIFDLVRQWRLKPRAIRLVVSPLFLSHWYLARYPDVRAAGMDPALHYITHGAAEDRWPHPLFDPDWYRQQLGHAIPDRSTPLEHYRSLPAEKRPSTHPLFDPHWYRSQNPEVATSGIDRLEPLLLPLAEEGRSQRQTR